MFFLDLLKIQNNLDNIMQFAHKFQIIVHFPSKNGTYLYTYYKKKYPNVTKIQYFDENSDINSYFDVVPDNKEHIYLNSSIYLYNRPLVDSNNFREEDFVPGLKRTSDSQSTDNKPINILPVDGAIDESDEETGKIRKQSIGKRKRSPVYKPLPISVESNSSTAFLSSKK